MKLYTVRENNLIIAYDYISNYSIKMCKGV